MKLKTFEFTVGRNLETNSPVVVAIDENKNPRMAGDEKFYLKSEADKMIADKEKAFEYSQAVVLVDIAIIRSLKRELWLVRAERANEIHFMWCQFIYDKKYSITKFNIKKEWGQNIKQGQTLHTPQGWADVWEKVERNCRAMADKFK